jgi:hypothetical protein
VGKLRFFLILLLSVALDFSSPVMPEGMEGLEEFEEASHRARARRSVRLAREHAGPPVRQPVPHVQTRPAPAVRVAPLRRPVSDIGLRKVPVTIADSTSTPEDH